ncbi:hypothetical protein QBC37DRAFT_444238 [Rhypophila decipiens]|uniref:Uncharacterized protein n=1 Tax=Rhypophila decipiens TaxID=261697 RepID=A0AAN7B2T8_9PEZI|nr:hypothetical protein QBC37DRAFT_444238 [Rhypophila decipiens]
MGALAFLSGVALVQAQEDVFKFCPESTCGDCPVGLTSQGTGFPNCVIYNSDDVFPGLGFTGSEGGGWKPYLDVAQPDPNCKTLVKSPASTSEVGCGYLIAAFSQPVCAVVELELSFMVQFCCGIDECNEAVGSSSAFSAADFPASSSSSLSTGKRISTLSGGVLLKYPNGTVIPPAEMGPPPAVKKRSSPRNSNSRVTRLRNRSTLHKRDCEEGSWNQQEEYTRPADNTQIVSRNAVGPGTIEITASRTQSYTTSMNIGFADILSFGLGFEVQESFTDSTAFSFTLEEGQSGNVGFTAFLRCTRGSGRCNDGDVEGEICTPLTVEQGGQTILDGKYAVVIDS